MKWVIIFRLRSHTSRPEASATILKIAPCVPLCLPRRPLRAGARWTLSPYPAGIRQDARSSRRKGPLSAPSRSAIALKQSRAQRRNPVQCRRAAAGALPPRMIRRWISAPQPAHRRRIAESRHRHRARPTPWRQRRRARPHAWGSTPPPGVDLNPKESNCASQISAQERKNF